MYIFLKYFNEVLKMFRVAHGHGSYISHEDPPVIGTIIGVTIKILIYCDIGNLLIVGLN